MLQTLLDTLNWLWLNVVAASAMPLGEGLYGLTIAPLSRIGVPPFFQVLFIGLLAAGVSVTIKRVLKIEEKEALFQHRISKKQEIQKYLPALKDWKLKKVLLEATDDEIDEIYNTYIAYKFSWFGMVYLLPIFLTLFWLDWLPDFRGPRFLLAFPENSLGIPGLSVPATFFLGYIPGLILLNRLRKRLGRRQGAASCKAMAGAAKRADA